MGLPNGGSGRESNAVTALAKMGPEAIAQLGVWEVEMDGGSGKGKETNKAIGEGFGWVAAGQWGPN